MSTTITGTLTGRTEADVGDPWRGFRGQGWRDSIDPRLFLQDNDKPYEGDASFLETYGYEIDPRVKEIFTSATTGGSRSTG